MNKSRILYLFTRTPLHVGAGTSVGAIDQPIIRERHTGFPIIPASSLKGTFADAWEAELEENGKKFLRVTSKEIEKEGKKEIVPDVVKDAAWLFGSNNDKVAFTGSLQFSEAKLLALRRRDLDALATGLRRGARLSRLPQTLCPLNYASLDAQRYAQTAWPGYPALPVQY
jgi:CRISPR type III-B/RAMP module RAMP protein Cmr4